MNRNKLTKIYVFAVLMIVSVSATARQFSPFDFSENNVDPSPLAAEALKLQQGERVIDFDVSPVRPEAAIIVRSESGKQRILFWMIGSGNTAVSSRAIDVPPDVTLSAIAWHPLAKSLFLMTKSSKQHEILRTPAESWYPTIVYRSMAPLQRLVVAPRPFQTGFDRVTRSAVTSYRVFFAIKKSNGTHTTHSVTEDGKGEYAVLDSVPAKGESQASEEAPNVLIVNSALPEIFHPAGHVMLWEDSKHCFHKALYRGVNWGDISEVFKDGSICGGSLTYTPNGANMLHWQKGLDGVVLISDHGKKTATVAKGVRFLSTPSSVADGKGIVGVISEGSALSVAYVPIEVPLADVVNAWMFLESPHDEELLSQHTGLFRTLGKAQLYELYDSESYACGGYDYSTPSRPYFVTTDIFWELYASAFEGIFILSERQAAVPNFWKFVTDANASLQKNPKTKVAKAFSALMAVQQGLKTNPEAARILKSEGSAVSSVTNEPFDFGNLKPRSHYVADGQLGTYFQASKYLMDLRFDDGDFALIKSLPRPVLEEALAWINVYTPFIAPSRGPLIWGDSKQIPGYILNPVKRERIFPLSWGMDNEVLFNTVYHADFSAEEQVDGPGGKRLIPSGVDIAAVLGSKMAETILEDSGEFQKYPPLKTQLASLRKRYEKSPPASNDTLYQRWLSALSAQWAENVPSPSGTIQAQLWSKKRLQTGLASWATLRHTTILVNERSAAECGEGGFEAIILRPPRGYVEPDPQTLDGIAGLFDSTIDVVKSIGIAWKGSSNLGGDKGNQGLQEGVIRRLTESRDKVRHFGAIARKELEGKPLTSQEYEEILYVGRAAEHNFLIFKSLATKYFALSTPDPIAKVADVASGGDGELLLVGVGNPLEWDQIVPFYGRKELVKGATYSYYETTSNQVMTDEEWRENLPGMAHVKWIAPYISSDTLSCPAKEP